MAGVESAQTPDTQARLAELLAKQEITELLYRYCRGVDRLDMELVRSCYHPDATDSHGTFEGTVDEYLVWSERLLRRYTGSVHMVLNMLVEIEPEAVVVNGNGTNGNGHHDDFDIGPTVELVPASGPRANGNGHAPVPVNGNGHHDEDGGEPQQMVFSWAEFMAEEPVKPKRRNGKPQAATMSMFEWAAELEQAREKETVGAGR